MEYGIKVFNENDHHLKVEIIPYTFGTFIHQSPVILFPLLAYFAFVVFFFYAVATQGGMTDQTKQGIQNGVVIGTTAALIMSTR